MSVRMKTYNQSTERKTIHLLLHSESAIEQAIALGVSEDDFGLERHKSFFNTIIDIYLEDAISVGADIDVMINNLEYDDDEDKKSSILSLNKLVKLQLKGGKEVPIKMLPTYVKELQELKVVREVVRGIQGVTRCLGNEDASVQDLLISVESLDSALMGEEKSVRMNMKEAVTETIRDLIDEAESDNRVKFYIPELDDKAKILKGYVTYIAGASGIGKSAVLENLAKEQSANGVRVLYVSMEMSIVDNVKRMISMNEDINAQKMLLPKLLKAKDWKTIEDMLDGGELPTYGIHWFAKPNIDIKELQAEIKKQVKLHDVDVVMIDYYQLLELDHNTDLPDSIRIPKVSRALSVLAGQQYVNPYGKPKEISIIALSQLVKEVEYRENKRPTMNDLYFGGYKDARLVIGLYRDEYYNPEDTTKPNVMEFGIIKQNNGVMNEWVDTYYDSNIFGIRALTDSEKALLSEYEDDDDDYDYEYDDE